MADSASLTSVSLLGNNIDDETASMASQAREKPTLVTLCGFEPDQTKVDIWHGPEPRMCQAAGA